MGVVHLGAGRRRAPRVALKVLRPHIVGDDEARDRLAREVNSLSRVRSPRVAEIIDADPWATIPYVATRYVPGLSLHDHVTQEGPITGADLTWFARALAEGLDAVHAVGVLHRDVKPSNVLMEGRTPILIDFGLARVADDPRLTHTGWLLGTPGYLAPEILHGDDATDRPPTCTRWAATVAFAGTGRPPFGRGPSMAIMDRVRRGEHDLGGLDPRLLPLVCRGLDPDPARRRPLAEVLHALGAVPPARARRSTTCRRTQPHDLESPLRRRSGPDTAPRLRRAGHPPPGASRRRAATTRTRRRTTTRRPNRRRTRPRRPRTGTPSRAADRPVRRRLDPGRLGGPAAARAGGRAVPPRPAGGSPRLAGSALAARRRAVPHRGRAGRAGGCCSAHVARPARAPPTGAACAAAKWYDVLLTPLTAPWFLLASLPGTFLLLTWAGRARRLAAALVLARPRRRPRLGLFSLGAPHRAWCCGPAPAPPAALDRCAGSRVRWPGRAQLGGRDRLPAGAGRGGAFLVAAGHRLVAGTGRAGVRRHRLGRTR